jgi:hypothetical protein
MPEARSPDESEHDPTEIDWDDMKQRLREAIRGAIQQHADELGISYDACIDRYFGGAGPSDSADSDPLTPPASSR